MSSSSSSSSGIEVVLSFQGQKVPLSDLSVDTRVGQLDQTIRSCFSLPPDASIKLLYKGKDLFKNKTENDIALPAAAAVAAGSSCSKSRSKKPPIKLLVMASTQESVSQLNAKKSDPTIRGFDQERPKQTVQKNANIWNTAGQDKNYKFCRFQACTWQSFGHRASDTKTPHAFAAMELLEQLATDPGIVAIVKERELVVGTLGEMDPIDDRLKQKKEAQGACLLGYNTNHGARIDLKLRPDSLDGFLPYPQIVSTLIHELSHNWVGEHDLLFWANFGQMRVAYLHKHASLAASGVLVKGQTTMQLAGVQFHHQSNGGDDGNGMMNSIYNFVLAELKAEMAQHGLSPDPIATAILDRCRELTVSSQSSELGRTIGSSSGDSTTTRSSGGRNPRQLALQAAEQRARQQKENKKKGDKKSGEE